MMRPVLTATEYRNLRQTNRQQSMVTRIRQGDDKLKHRLLQMNYSCIPESRLLKGCKTPSNSVGMDVDLDPSDPDYDRKMAEIPARVLAKQEELGLLMLERSARKGYHLVFRRRFTEGLSEGHILENQVMNLRWASELLGVKFDSGAKDITRVFFSTTADQSDLLFLNDELFDNTPCPATAAVSAEVSAPTLPAVSAKQLVSNEQTVSNEQAAAAEQVASAGRQVLAGRSVAAEQQVSNEQTGSAEQVASAEQTALAEPAVNDLKYMGIPFRAIIQRYFDLFNEGRLPQEGDRNVKTFELAMLLRPICDYAQEKLEAVIPRYDGFPEEEWRRTIESALKEPRKGMPFRLRQVLNALRQESKIAATGGTIETPPLMPEKLPHLLDLLSSKVPTMYKPAVCEGVFPALGTHLHGVKFCYWDNVEHEATFMHVLIASMSIGKGSIKKPIDYILADIKQRDKPNRLREAEWKRQNPAGKTKAKDPRPSDICIQILIDNLTDAVFNQRVVDAHENGGRFIYTRVDEVEQLRKVTSRGTIDEVSILIRKAFDNAEHGQERVGADSVTGIAPLRWNFNASTTIPNAHRFFQKAVNDGTLSRLYLSTILKPRSNSAHGSSREEVELPIFGVYDDQFAQSLKPYIERLSAANGLIECPQALSLAKELTIENDKRASLYESEAYRVLSYRANVIAYLKGMVLYVAEGYKWSQEIEDYVRWSEQMDLWCKMRFFGRQLEEEIKAEEQQINASPKNLLSLLPSEFTYEDFLQMRQQQGRTGDGRNTLRTWKSRGYIEFDEITGSWHKVDALSSFTD
ncbi:MAG: hypothetical protein SO169_07760 [Parabacteroides sp.]|nr:hypothetical protein [Parabacteroides sp.]